MKLLFVGDVVGKVGRKLLKRELPKLISRWNPEVVVVNVENAAGGFGLTAEVWRELSSLPVDVFTSGNHVWDKKETMDILDEEPHLLRPANYPDGNPGRGLCVIKSRRAGLPVAILNLQGRIFMAPIDSPFRTADRLLAGLPSEVKVILVDMHAEATSEKQALGWYLDGKVTAVVGTHTHVPTADERILPQGTAFITDVGMTGAYQGVIGFRPKEVLERFLQATPRALEPANAGGALAGVVITVNPQNGRATEIQRIFEKGEDASHG